MNDDYHRFGCIKNEFPINFCTTTTTIIIVIKIVKMKLEMA